VSERKRRDFGLARLGFTNEPPKVGGPVKRKALVYVGMVAVRFQVVAADESSNRRLGPI